MSNFLKGNVNFATFNIQYVDQNKSIFYLGKESLHLQHNKTVSSPGVLTNTTWEILVAVDVLASNLPSVAPIVSMVIMHLWV